MKKPEPIAEIKKPMDFIDMGRWIDEKYNINARDYAGKFKNAPNWSAVAAENGVTLDRAKELYNTSPLNVTDPVEKAAMTAASAVLKEHYDKTPYQDFWHFQIELFNNFHNDSYQTLNLLYQLEACEEEWQREIAKLWLDEYGEFMDEEGDVFLWVSW